MKSNRIIIASILCFTILPVLADPIKSKGINFIPMNVSCVIDSSNNYNVAWDEIDQAKKYAVELNCETEIGELKIKPSNKEASCTSEGNCTSSVTQNDFASALNEAVENSDISFPEGEFSLTFACTASVRGLPAPRHTRLQGQMGCDGEAQEGPGNEEESVKKEF